MQVDVLQRVRIDHMEDSTEIAWVLFLMGAGQSRIACKSSHQGWCCIQDLAPGLSRSNWRLYQYHCMFDKCTRPNHVIPLC